VAVVGGGISGLAAALFLAERPGLRVTVLEAADAIGGKLRAAEVAGLSVDVGAETMLARRPEGVELARRVGLGADLVAPATSAAGLWTRGAIRPLPLGQVMGVPGDLRALAASGVLARPALGRVALDRLLPATPLDRALAAGEDVAVGRYVAARLGRAVVDRLVEPLLGGVYAGRADELSLLATVPALAAAAGDQRSLLAAAARVAAAGAGRTEPVFAGLRGGVARLADAVAAAAGAEIRTATTVRALRRTPSGWELTLGPTRAPGLLTADAVVLALPARPAARLLAGEVPAAAVELAGVDYASVALVTLALPAGSFAAPPEGSGFLVPPVDGREVKAATFSSVKWGWLAEAAGLAGLVVVRCSFGRYGETHVLQRDDAELVAAAVRELRAATGLRGTPVDAHVMRWGGSLPQYAVGHLDRVSRVRSAVDEVPGLAVCGAAYDGVGIPACVASARRAADRVLAGLARGGQWAHG